MEDAVAGIAELRRLHVQMGEAVLEGYDFDSTQSPQQPTIKLRHDLYEVTICLKNKEIIILASSIRLFKQIIII
ncbi:hypothetical protein FHX64_001547 [Microbacter margulisiae]|uniref:Uncharacterized protein n=1 Tax=Microbacter margulisiae TaxID=1350067 RepID=A0A7W5H289_9PORP|nr:hypothetical protein [Microbacter margulisiae]